MPNVICPSTWGEFYKAAVLKQHWLSRIQRNLGENSQTVLKFLAAYKAKNSFSFGSARQFSQYDIILVRSIPRNCQPSYNDIEEILLKSPQSATLTLSSGVLAVQSTCALCKNLIILVRLFTRTGLEVYGSDEAISSTYPNSNSPVKTGITFADVGEVIHMYNLLDMYPPRSKFDDTYATTATVSAFRSAPAIKEMPYEMYFVQYSSD